MEPTSEATRDVLSEIERTIQDALDHLHSEHLGEAEADHLCPNVNPTHSIPNLQIQDSNKDLKIQNSHSASANDFVRSPSPAKVNYSFSKSSLKSDSSNESIKMPILGNPIEKTIEEMQRVLDATYGEATQFLNSSLPSPSARKTSVQSPRNEHFEQPPNLFSPGRTAASSPAQEHSPEEILNIFSQDLGICPSTSPSARREHNYQLFDGEHQKSKSNKKEKITLKKDKPKKLKMYPDTKLDIKRNKIINAENLPSKENRLKELRNIYCCSNKPKKPNFDLTLKSKSRRNKSSVSKSSLNNMTESCKASSMTVSKKHRKKKLEMQDVDLSSDYISLEKMSKLSAKRKLKQRNSSAKVWKKQNLKRKIEPNLSIDKTENKLSKSYIDSQFSINHKSNNLISRNKDVKYPKQTKPNNYMKTDHITCQTDTHKHEPTKRTKILKVSPPTKNYDGVKPNSKLNNSEIENNKISISNRQSQEKIEHNDLNNTNFLKKKISNETKLNKHVLFTGNGQNNSKNDVRDNKEINNSQLCYDSINGDLLDQPSLHYTLPTHSSRSKEVERFLNGHYQHLPFVIGQSTNKSHNLWVNIQEALSLLKQKVPQAVDVQNGVVFDSNDDRPISIISKLTSKSVKKPHQCPALHSDVLYDIPEVNEAGSMSWENHPDCLQANIDPDNVRPRCSCLSQPSLSYKKVLHQIFGGGYELLSDVSGDLNGARQDFMQEQGESYTNELRKVLVSFTHEFEQLNNKYEEMLQDPNAPKEELLKLETTLQNKEEEIKDIITRFQEMREISEKTHLDGGKSRTGPCSLESYKSTTSIRLAQTLRRVQQFKESLKSRPSVPYLAKSIHLQNVLAQ